MHITEKWRPKFFSELIGNKKQIDNLRRQLPEKVCIITGPPGVGKTTFAYVWARENNYNVIEINSSDDRNINTWKSVGARIRMKLPRKTLFLLEEVDGINWKKFEKIIGDILKLKKHPVIMTCNDGWKIPDSIKSKSYFSRFYNPSLREILVRFKQIEAEEKLKFNYKKITGDIRSSLIAISSDSDKPEKEKNPFEIVRDLFEKGLTDQLDLQEHGQWLIENIPNFYSGIEMYRAYKILQMAVIANEVEILTVLPRADTSGEVSYPYLWSYSKAYKVKKQKEKIKNAKK